MRSAAASLSALRPATASKRNQSRNEFSLSVGNASFGIVTRTSVSVVSTVIITCTIRKNRASRKRLARGSDVLKTPPTWKIRVIRGQ